MSQEFTESSKIKYDNSLIKYDHPVELIESERQQENNNTDKSSKWDEENKKRLLKSNFLVGENKPDLQNLLNIIIPPREWVIESKTFIQYVSHSSASREDVINLQKLLDERLMVRQVRCISFLKNRQKIQEFVRFVKNFILNALMKLSDK
jgi:hypothetical protein